MDWTDHYYYNSRWQVLEVRRDTGSGEDADPRETYVWHPYYIDALATRFYDASMGGTQVQHYFTHDANFNVTAVLSDAGAVVERYHYTPYGELTVLDADFSDDSGGVSDMENPYTFTGRRFDEESGFYQYRNRYYGAEVGRFVTRDPIAYLGSEWNLYEYVEGKPLLYTDPYGLDLSGQIGSLRRNCRRNRLRRKKLPKRDPCPWGERVATISAVGVIDAASAVAILDEAWKISRQLTKGGLTNPKSVGPANAFQHCYASCRLAKTIGAGQAKEVGDIHERCRPSGGACNTAMDLANNQIGIDISKRGGKTDCYSGCLKAAESGKLKTLANGKSPNGPIPKNPPAGC